MKLNFMKPNAQNATKARHIKSSPLLAILLLSITVAKCFELPTNVSSAIQSVAGRQITSDQQVASAEQIAKAASQKQRNVANLRLTSDFRAVKLRWSYEQVDANEPVNFDIRFCELTSWNKEIKCRQRDLKVDLLRNKTSDDSVIRLLNDSVHQTTARTQKEYEAHIYDLRALTNYTFQVQVSRFSNESPQLQTPSDFSQDKRIEGNRIVRGRGSSARRLDGVALENWTDATTLRVETKAFSAEATKCLADVSEVVIDTGRYFGGRISVEDSMDPRCNLIGNRSSEQTRYLFRIDHEICDSKIMDGNRIETMILVHENKDILTHNTAKFLVLCNFQQKSFTMRASVSLPKVNGQMAPVRPAVITSLPGKSAQEVALGGQVTSHVMLGSMPGVFRSRVAQENESVAQSGSKEERSNVTKLEESSETNVIEKPKQKESRIDGYNREISAKYHNRNTIDGDRARALKLFAEPEKNVSNKLPQPVQLQSNVLYIEPSGAAKQRAGRFYGQKIVIIGDIPSVNKSSVEKMATSIQPMELASESKKKYPSDLATQVGVELNADSQTAPIVMTNNHRVSGDFLQATQQKVASGDSGYSIKYSAAKIDEFPVGRGEETTSAEMYATGGDRTTSDRTGRMRSLQGDQLGSSWTVDSRRMGEMSVERRDLVAEPSGDVPILAPANASLAHNITSYLLKWSLKALTNLARKSLESLAKGGNNDTEWGNEQQLKENPTVGSDYRGAQIGHKLEESESSTSEPFFTTMKSVTSKVTLASERNGNSAQRKEIVAARSGGTVSTTANSNNRVATTTENSLDGFITERRSSNPDSTLAATVTTTNKPLDSQLRHRTRPANYSKSLNLDRSEQVVGKQKISEKNESSAWKRADSDHSVARNMDGIGRDHKESVIISNNSILLYGFIGIIMLILGIFLTLWLVSSPLRRPSSSESSCVHPKVYSRNAPSSGSIFANVDCNETGGRLENQSGHRACEYNRYDNVSSDCISKSSLLANDRLSRPSQLSPSLRSSQSTRSTSAGSHSMSDENDCKTNEFLYSEHVLINTGSSLGESFA